MRIDTEDLISVTDANRMGVSRLVSEAAGGRTRVVMCKSEPAAVVTSLEHFNRLQRLDEMEQDLRLLALAVVRTGTETGKRHSLADVADEFGVDLDED